MERSTEQDSRYRHLEKMDTLSLIQHINKEDQTVALSVEKAIPQIEILAEQAYQCLKNEGRLFYIGSGTSGRLGIVDASECPPTFGVPPGMVVGIIAGGDKAIRKAQEGAEDDMQAAWTDLQAEQICNKDIVIGISASGTTPYVLGGLKACREQHIATGCIVCNNGSPVAAIAQYPIEVVTGPEFVTGSTRMKAGTAQKLVMNMITTTAMIKLGRVKDNKMVDMQLSNRKLVDRGTRMLVNLYQLKYEEAEKLLLELGSVRAVIAMMQEKV